MRSSQLPQTLLALTVCPPQSPFLARRRRIEWWSTTTRKVLMGKRILFVEDDASFRDVFPHALREALAHEHLDIAFVEAGSLSEAHSRLRVGGPLPTLVLTASLETSVAARAMEAGARGALSKLASMTETVDAIKRLTDAERSSA